ncbi:hypothetical protein [Embleya scabrispora]|uniref:hypothetical protein n=1 Tax=Embleya scabrispora TaxID=159449 RepID=UPI00036A9A24|nr:hypothetical protein [Embleya scabrispora]MYS87482.1 hypothetical protein [Streptomyces sp. SID5474]
MTRRLCTHAALTLDSAPILNQATGELRLPITLYDVDREVGRVDLVVSGIESASPRCLRPDTATVGPSGFEDRPIAVRLEGQGSVTTVHWTREQFRNMVQAGQAELARTLPGPIIQRCGTQGNR